MPLLVEPSRARSEPAGISDLIVTISQRDHQATALDVDKLAEVASFNCAEIVPKRTDDGFIGIVEPT
jgi:hypothetical protein